MPEHPPVLLTVELGTRVRLVREAFRAVTRHFRKETSMTGVARPITS